MPTDGFEILRHLMRSFKNDELDLEILCDEIGDVTSDPEIRVALANRLLDYAEKIEEYDTFRSVLDQYRREDFVVAVNQLIESYISGRYYENRNFDA